MKRTLLGLLILAIIAGAIVAFQFYDPASISRGTVKREPVALSIYYGGEKSAFLANPKVQDILKNDYKIDLDARKAGSIEMATTLDVDGKSCLWPSNSVAVEFARESGKTVKGDEIIFNSPIVFYAWNDVRDALIAKGVVRQEANGFYFADMKKIMQLIESEASWKDDLGLNIYGNFKIFSTDPTKSNSGNIWSGMLATAYNGGHLPEDDDMPILLPKIDGYFEQLGFIESSSGDIFNNFLKQGMGSRPMIVGYENQLVEFLLEHENVVDDVNAKISVIYPEPTVFATHPLILLDDKCERLEEALMDERLQNLAWVDHGFRTGLIGISNNPDDLKVAKVPENIPNVEPMPKAAIMQAIVQRLEN